MYKSVLPRVRQSKRTTKPAYATKNEQQVQGIKTIHSLCFLISSPIQNVLCTNTQVIFAMQQPFLIALMGLVRMTLDYL